MRVGGILRSGGRDAGQGPPGLRGRGPGLPGLLRTLWRVGLVGAGSAILFAVAGEPLMAQAEALGQQRLGRAYWHVFAAYAVGWALILGWIVSIARRLGKVEERLQRKGE